MYQFRVVESLVLIGFRSADASERNTLYYKYGASDDRYFRFGFNAALFWRAILLARENGYSRLDQCRASDANEKSLAEFKRRLGAEKFPLGYFSSFRAYAESGDSAAARAAFSLPLGGPYSLPLPGVGEVDAAEFGMERDALYESLKQWNVFTRRYFYPLIYDYSCYRSIPVRDPLTVARRVSIRILTLPIYYDLGLENVE